MNENARVVGLEEDKASVFLKPLFAAYKKVVGRVSTSLKVQSHRPSIAWFGNLLGVAIEKSGKLENRIHVFAQLRAAQTVDCAFCIDIIPAIGKKQGAATAEELASVANWQNSKLFSEREKIAIEYAEEISKTPVRVADELFERLKLHFDEPQIVELTASIAYENYRARFNRALKIESDNFNS